ncbi:MAG: hypothetical protein PHN22_02290, partial [Candidatus ainarchaeum sp.]|nr:hypothetical protein [Candidatus ainarchaeum sp.]
GDNTTGDNTTGDNTTGDNTTGDNTTGDNTTGDNTTGDNTTGDNTTGDDTTGDDTTGDDVVEEPTVIDSTYLIGLDNYNNNDYTGPSAPAKTLFTNVARYANKLAGNTKYNYATASNSDICGKNNCSDWTSIDQVEPGQIIGYTSPNSANNLGYFVIYLGKDNQGTPKVFRLSGSRNKILIENFNESYGASYNLKKVITNKK